MKNKKEFLRALKFALISISAGIIQLLVFTLLNELANFPYWPSYLISLVLSVVWNFTINRKYTFRTVENIPLAMAKIFGFYLVFTPLSTLFGNWLVSLGWNEYLVLLINMVLNMALEYVFYVLFVYKNKIDNAVKEQPETEK